MEDTKAFTLKYREKNSWFDCHRRFLDSDNPYRCNRYRFRKNVVENDETPIRLNGHQIWERAKCLPKITKIGKSIILPGYGVEHN